MGSIASNFHLKSDRSKNLLIYQRCRFLNSDCCRVSSYMRTNLIGVMKSCFQILPQSRCMIPDKFFSTLSMPSFLSHVSQPCRTSSPCSINSLCDSTAEKKYGFSMVNYDQHRFVKDVHREIKNKKLHHYSSTKRINKFGLEARLSSVAGRKILFRKVMKNKSCLTVFDRILPDLREPKSEKARRKKRFVYNNKQTWLGYYE